MELLKDFAYENNIKIIYDIHEVNEDIFTKVKPAHKVLVSNILINLICCYLCKLSSFSGSNFSFRFFLCSGNIREKKILKPKIPTIIINE